MSETNHKSFAELKANYDQMELDFKLQLAEMHKQVVAAQKREQADAIEKIRSLMHDFGLSNADLGTIAKAKKEKTGKVAVKYRGPNGETWTGRGRAPLWLGPDRDKYKVTE